jgi:hypothetical protein
LKREKNRASTTRNWGNNELLVKYRQQLYKETTGKVSAT